MLIKVGQISWAECGRSRTLRRSVRPAPELFSRFAGLAGLLAGCRIADAILGRPKQSERRFVPFHIFHIERTVAVVAGIRNVLGRLDRPGLGKRSGKRRGKTAKWWPIRFQDSRPVINNVPGNDSVPIV